MTKTQIGELIAKYASKEGLGSSMEWGGGSTQFDDYSASINYSMVRKYKPKVVIEFGSRTGRCSHDILRALIKNGGKYTFKSYELEDDLRKDAQRELDTRFGKDFIVIGGDIMEAKDVPDKIDYAFIDNYHDLKTTEWVLSTLLPKCNPGCLVQIHDWTLKDDWQYAEWGHYEETELFKKLHEEGKLPLTKLYWSIDEGNIQCQSAWFIYNP